MPGAVKREPASRPWDLIGEYITQEHLLLKFGCATHDHWDHFSIYPQFHKRFPDVPIIVHRSFFPGEWIAQFITPEDIAREAPRTTFLVQNGTPIYCFQGLSFETNLAGEPLYLVHAPKHCQTDTIVLFRGFMITGDWRLGPGDPNPNKVPIPNIHASIDFLVQFCHQRIKIIFSMKFIKDLFGTKVKIETL